MKKERVYEVAKKYNFENLKDFVEYLNKIGIKNKFNISWLDDEELKIISESFNKKENKNISENPIIYNGNYLSVEIINIDENYSLIKVIKNYMPIIKIIEGENIALKISDQEASIYLEDLNLVILGAAPLIINSYYNVEILKGVEMYNEFINNLGE